MSIADARDLLLDFFVNQHILVRVEWINELIGFLSQRIPPGTSENASSMCELAFEQWLHADISDTSLGCLDALGDKPSKAQLHHPVVVQIVDLLDVGVSLHSQFRKLTYEFVDHSGFDFLPPEDRDEVKYEAKPTRCLLLTVTDGSTTLQAMENRPIPCLSLLTKPGSKLLLRPPVQCRRGILFLDKENCLPLGGDVIHLMESGRPLQIMALRLGTAIPQPKNNNLPLSQPEEAVAESEPEVGADREEYLEMETGEHEDFPACTIQPRTQHPSPRLPPSPRLSPTLPHSVQQSRRSFDCERIQSPAVSSSLGSQSSASLRGDAVKSNEQRYSLRDETVTPSRNRMRKVKQEIPVVNILDSPPSAASARNDRNEECDSPSRRMATTTTEHPLVLAYQSFSLSTLDQALRGIRFVVGNRTKRIQAFVMKVEAPLRIVDDLWTMEVLLSDHTRCRVHCIVADEVLSHLIGMPASEAQAIRNSSDISRKREGGTRIAAAQKAMSRLDVIFDIQFFSTAKAAPVIRKMLTLPDALDCLS